MELRVLRYFLAVAREENITAAAETLHLTQPTLSKQLMELERELGKKLFLRGKRKITLTEDGMFLRRRAQEIVELADRTEADLQSPGGIIEGDVAIGAGETEAVRLIAQTIRRLHTRYPGIRYHLFSGNGEDVAERLDKGLIDFALFIGRVDLKKYDYLRLPGEDVWGLLLQKGHPLAQREQIHPEDLEGLPLLCSRQALIRNELSGWMGCGFENLNIVATYNLIYNAAQMVREGIGAALCLDRLTPASGSSGLCFRPFAPRVTAERTVAWKKQPALSKAAAVFLDELHATLCPG